MSIENEMNRAPQQQQKKNQYPRRPYSIYLVRLFRLAYLHVMVILKVQHVSRPYSAARRWLELLHGTPTGLSTINMHNTTDRVAGIYIVNKTASRAV